MSEVNFEALGRCQYLKEEIKRLHDKRDKLFYSIKHGYPEYTVSPEAVIHYYDSRMLRAVVDELDDTNMQLISAVEEYNKWAKEVNQPLIKIIKDHRFD